MNKIKVSLADIAAMLFITLCFLLIISLPSPEVREVYPTPYPYTPGYYERGGAATPTIYVRPTYSTNYKSEGVLCNDGTISKSAGKGTCSYHGGISELE